MQYSVGLLMLWKTKKKANLPCMPTSKFLKAFPENMEMKYKRNLLIEIQLELIQLKRDFTLA